MAVRVQRTLSLILTPVLNRNLTFRVEDCQASALEALSKSHGDASTACLQCPAIPYTAAPVVHTHLVTRSKPLWPVRKVYIVP